MTSNFSKLLILGAALALFNCKGKDNDPAPVPDPSLSYIKAMENGSFKGTFKGTRRDGTAFEEPFEYKLASEPEGFYQKYTTLHQLYIYRYEGISSENGVGVGLDIENKGTSSQSVKISDFDIDFSKILSDRSLFTMGASAHFATADVTLPISRANINTYKLVNFGRDNRYTYDEATNKNYYTFKDTDGNTIYFSYSNVAPYDYKYEFYITPVGSKVTSSAVWNNVYYDSWDQSVGEKFYIYGGANLYEVLSVPADTQQISNFTYNATTGEVSFDYTINIQQYRNYNTTNNPLEIKGSVKAVVYESITQRKSFEGKNG